MFPENQNNVRNCGELSVIFNNARLDNGALPAEFPRSAGQKFRLAPRTEFLQKKKKCINMEIKQPRAGN